MAVLVERKLRNREKSFCGDHRNRVVPRSGSFFRIPTIPSVFFHPSHPAPRIHHPSPPPLLSPSGGFMSIYISISCAKMLPPGNCIIWGPNSEPGLVPTRNFTRRLLAPPSHSGTNANLDIGHVFPGRIRKNFRDGIPLI